MTRVALRSAMLALVLLGVNGACAAGERLSGTGIVVLEGASLFTSTDSTFRPNAVVVVDHERITRVGTVGQFTYGPGITVLDLRGRFIVPGFVDMHAHVPGSAREETARELLAYGITTARSPGVSDSMSGVPLRESLAHGAFPGPRLIT